MTDLAVADAAGGITPAKQKVALAVCESEFEKMCAARRVSTSLEGLNKKELASFAEIKKSLLGAMSRGELVLRDGNPVYTPPGGKPITFYKPTGATLMAGDGYAENANVERLVAIATELTKSPPGTLAALELEEFRIVSDLTNLFLARR